MLTTCMIRAQMGLENKESFMSKKNFKGLRVVTSDLEDKEKAQGLYVSDKVVVEVEKLH